MEGGERPSRPAERSRHLDEAAGVPARIRLRARGQHVRRLALAERRRRLRLDDVVDPGTAAADLLLRRLDAARDPGSRRAARAAATATRCAWREVARVLEGDPQRQRMPLRARPAASELGDVDDRFGRRRDPSGASRSPPRSSTIVVVAARARRASCRARARDPPRAVPACACERAAAALRARHVHLVAVRREHARGRSVHVAEDDALRRSPSAAATRAGRSPRRRLAGGALGRAPRRRERSQRPRAARAPAACASASAAPQPPPVREHGEDRRAQQALASGPRRWFCLHVARASARSAGRTARPTGTRSRRPCSRGSGRSARRPCLSARPSRRRGRLHEPDPTARRVHLLVAERRSVGQRREAEAAVHAVLSSSDPASEARTGSNAARTPLGERRPRAARPRSSTNGDPRPGPREQAVLASRTRTRPGSARLERAPSSSQTGVGLVAAGRGRPAPSTAASPPSKSSAHPAPAEVDRARRRAASGAARPRACAVVVSRRRCASPPGAGAAAARRARSRPSRPREPEKSLPRS